MENLIRRGEAQDLLKCYTQKNNLGHTPYEIVSNLPPAGPHWISVEERMPALDTEVLVFAVGLPEWGFEGKTTMAIAHRFIYRFWSGGKEHEEWSTPWEYFHKDYKITHWMPLPEPPEEGNNE